MAITASGLYCVTFEGSLKNTIALDLNAETYKGALFSNTITPNFTTDTAYGVSPYNANEITGTNWAAGGVALTGTTLSSSSGSLVFDATDVSVASATFTGARGYLYYADPLSDEAILLVNFGADYSPNNGTFSIVWNASGIFTMDLTP